MSTRDFHRVNVAIKTSYTYHTANGDITIRPSEETGVTIELIHLLHREDNRVVDQNIFFTYASSPDSPSVNNSLLAMPASDPVTRLNLPKLRAGFAALAVCVWTALAEPAAGGNADGAGHLPRKSLAVLKPSAFGICHRHCGEQRLCVGMQRVLIQRFGVRQLHDPAQVHHRHTIGDVANHRQIMGDHQVGQPALPL